MSTWEAFSKDQRMTNSHHAQRHHVSGWKHRREFWEGPVFCSGQDSTPAKHDYTITRQEREPNGLVAAPFSANMFENRCTKLSIDEGCSPMGVPGGTAMRVSFSANLLGTFAGPRRADV